MLGNIRQKTLDLARGPNAERTMWAWSFAESSFFPLPPDGILGLMTALEPKKWLRYAIGCTIASVLGGLLGYAIGLFLMESIGRHILGFFGYGAERQQELKAFYDEWGALAIFIKGLTPIPYKLVTILSGALQYSLPIFILASIITRGARFLLVAYLFNRFGPQIAPIIEKRLGLLLVVAALVIVLAVVALQFLHH
jgi:membrane protein YqaA with SNARE-associated domain